MGRDPTPSGEKIPSTSSTPPDEAERRAGEAREATRSRRSKTALIVLMAAVMIDVATVLSMARGILPSTTVAILTLALITVGLAALAAVLGHAPGPETRRPSARRDE